ncbi:MAG: HlyD family efflux transporter periplasmic adaptor subunit [Lachnospiraceae bacterium]|nr:HlyD family efflux transporter periplasmic adaptor subunit [Lachnospiraceae bacterium]
MGSKKKKNRKIVPYRRPKNLNVGMIIFAIIFVYMTFSVYTYMKRDKVQFYEVVDGGIVNEKDYTGIILRDETTKYTDRAGDINYYVREGKRASVGTSIYSIDETGSIAAFMAEHPEAGAALSEENLSDLKKQLTSFSITFQDEQFHSVYDTKYSLEAQVLEYANFNALDNLDAMLGQAGVNFQQVRADQAGVISYAIDSYEDLDVSQISEEVFNRAAYSRSITKSGQKVPKDSPVYKIVTSDNWSVVFPMTEEDAAEYQDSTSLRVSFDGKDLSVIGDFSIFTGTDGKTYGKLDFNKYMVQFISERYVQFEIVTQKVSGLKIPISAVTNKTFHLVPVGYLAKGGDGDDSTTGFMKEVYSEQGTSVVFVPATIYYSTEEYYYIDISDGNELNAGDYLVKPTGANIAEEDAASDEEGETEAETNDAASQAARAADSGGRFQIGASASLQGVYNINKGYAVFKQIEVLASNDEYYTIKKGMRYGLSVYDHIVLDASTVEEGKLIYQ